MKIIGCLLVIGILLSYAPVFHMDECAEGDHWGNMKMDCGVPFHCPMIVGIVVSEISSLPLSGRFAPTRMLPLSDGLMNPIFHPPEYSSPDFSPGDGGRRIIQCGTLARRLLIGIKKFTIFVRNPNFMNWDTLSA